MNENKREYGVVKDASIGLSPGGDPMTKAVTSTFSSRSSLPSSPSSSSTSPNKADVSLMNTVDSLAQSLESFKSSIEKVKTLNVGGIMYLDGMLDLCMLTTI